MVRRLEAAVAPDADVQVVAERGAERGREAVLAERRRQSVDEEASQVRRGRRPARPLPDDDAEDAQRGVRRRARAGLCLLYTSPSPRDQRGSRMPSSA